ncbi:hypothetical protein [Natrinema sp. 74]|uniref:hypothetical protein n=1 Tax=Natrinema sp. 74 TaxID=3384159 RepID=UPI0038D3A3B4
MDVDGAVQRTSDTADQAPMPDSVGGLGAAERLERVRERTDSSGPSSGISTPGGLGAAERLQRDTTQTETATERTQSGFQSDTHWSPGPNAPTSL